MIKKRNSFIILFLLLFFIEIIYAKTDNELENTLWISVSRKWGDLNTGEKMVKNNYGIVIYFGNDNKFIMYRGFVILDDNKISLSFFDYGSFVFKGRWRKIDNNDVLITYELVREKIKMKLHWSKVKEIKGKKKCKIHIINNTFELRSFNKVNMFENQMILPYKITNWQEVERWIED